MSGCHPKVKQDSVEDLFISHNFNAPGESEVVSSGKNYNSGKDGLMKYGDLSLLGVSGFICIKGILPETCS